MLISRRLLLDMAALVFASTGQAVAKPASGPLPNQLHAENERHQDLPEERDLLHMVYFAGRACDAMLEAHGEDCGCFICHDVLGLRYNLGVALNCLESSLLTRLSHMTDCPCCHQPWNDDAAT